MIPILEFDKLAPEDILNRDIRAEANVDAAAELVAKHGITANAQIAKRAIPQCNLTFLTGADMQQSVQDYYEILFQANPAAIGGAMPYDDFYYNP